ncbi:trypsin-like peptidase domain-containing protein [Anabaena minutissima FACHB-250]|nr:trypsin-like peptidase domain-containing protein [Anabaena minutissima FACHB-250]
MRFVGGLSAVLLGTAIVIVQPVATALTPSEVAAIAQQITVRIDGANTGSGVIIERQGNVYTVVTNWHVVQLKGNYTVQILGGKKYTFNNSQVKQFRGVDLAVFQFTSNANYRVAEKGNSDQVRLATNISVAGYPQGTSGIRFLRGAISSLESNPKDGYAFVYDIGGFPGMSGGAILDDEGKLVGIHGRATTRPDTNATTVFGIPLRTYLSLVPSVQPVATAPAPKPPVATAPTPKPQNPPVATAPAPKPPVANAPSVNTSLSAQFTLAKTLIGNTQEGRYGLIEGIVQSVAFSPDGKTVASSSLETTIKIWNIATGQVVRTLNDHSDYVASVAFSPDGRTLVSGSGDNTIKIWNLATGQVIRTLNGHSIGVSSVAISPDSKTLVSSSEDTTIKIWNMATGKLIRTLNNPQRVVQAAISPDGKTLASCELESNVKIWNLATGKVIHALTARNCSRLAFSPDSKTLALPDLGIIKIWNVATGQVIRTFANSTAAITSVAFSPNGKILASGDFKGIIKIWNLTTAQVITTLNAYSSPTWVNLVAFSSDSKILASVGSLDATIKIWRLSE